MLAALSVAEPSDEPVSLSAREIKVPKPRQICNLNDHGTASFQQKRPKANRTRWCVKEICYGRDTTPRCQGGVPTLSDSAARRLFLPSRNQPHDHGNDNQHRDHDSDIERSDQ